MIRISTPALLAAAALLVGLSAAAVAQSGLQVVGQKDRAFSAEVLTVAKGAQVRFQNDDVIAHNVQVRDPAGASRISTLQRPGDHTDIEFNVSGDNDVRCVIHPRMRMIVKVQ
jgi:plastocyanin